jgi:hypothetical protein
MIKTKEINLSILLNKPIQISTLQSNLYLGRKRHNDVIKKIYNLQQNIIINTQPWMSLYDIDNSENNLQLREIVHEDELHNQSAI